jgi:predicted AAA+ superfamily ATPase
MPAVVLTGARQTGKSTLAGMLAPKGRRYLSLDDLDVLDLARRDPDALIRGRSPLTLDEVQREPGLLLAVKRSIDRTRTPGRFLITGSANLLSMQRVSESLAGRASYLSLRPMTRREQLGIGTCGLWDELLSVPDAQWLDLLAGQEEIREDWRELARRGGFPTPALTMRAARERAVWFEGYARTYLERDLRDLSAITALPDFRRLMRAACLRLGRLLNQTELGRDVALPQPTVYRYLNLLETSYLLTRIAPYAVNRTKRLIKSPKLYWSDTGLALHLAGISEPEGAHLENLVLTDLLAWRDTRLGRVEILFWRTTTGDEVDFVIESGNQLVPVEVEAAGRPRLRDASSLLAFRREYRDTARAGLLLHAGSELRWLTEGVLAAPLWRVL